VEELEKKINSKRVAKNFVKAPEEEACGGFACPPGGGIGYVGAVRALEAGGGLRVL
jgi:hypothetical protein